MRNTQVALFFAVLFAALVSIAQLSAQSVPVVERGRGYEGPKGTWGR
jgi:hypothetical protein